MGPPILHSIEYITITLQIKGDLTDGIESLKDSHARLQQGLKNSQKTMLTIVWAMGTGQPNF